MTGLPLLDTYFQGNWSKRSGRPLYWYAGSPHRPCLWAVRIPYLDWASLHPGDAWIRNPTNDGHFQPERNVYAASQKDAYTDVRKCLLGTHGTRSQQCEHHPVFSDIILWLLRCAAEANDLTAARNYVNQVRTRALLTRQDGYNKNGGL